MYSHVIPDSDFITSKVIQLSLHFQLAKRTFTPGETIKGKLHVVVEKPMKARKVEITFIGMEQAQNTSGRRRVTEEHTIVVNRKTLWSASTDNLLPPTDVKYPFEFPIPLDALPSVNNEFIPLLPSSAIAKGIKRGILYRLPGKIEYLLSARIDKTLFSQEATVPVYILAIPQSGIKVKSLGYKLRDNSQRLQVSARVISNVFKPGDTIEGRIELKKHPMEIVRLIEASLYFAFHFKTYGKTTSFKQVTDIIRFPVAAMADYCSWEFKLASFINAPYSVSGSVVKIDWFIDVKVDLPHKRDKHIPIPLIANPSEAHSAIPGQPGFS